MMKDSDFQEKLIQIFYLINAAISSHRLYLSHNANFSGNLERAYGELIYLLQADEPITLFLAGEDIVVNRRRLKYVSPATEKFARILKSKGIESVTFYPGLTGDEFHQFVKDLASADNISMISRNCIKLGKVGFRIYDSDFSGIDENSDDTEISQKSGQFKHDMNLTTDQLAQELAEQYLKIHQEEKIDFREVGQILTKFMSELQRNISPIYLLGTVKSFHEYTYTHLINVAILTMSLVGEMGISGKHLLDVGIAALLHDVGKSFVPDEILNKTGMLSQQERAIIETHSLKGGLLLMKLVGIPKIVVLSAIEHHLKYDGSGYPFIGPGWKPNIVAQMITIADVFDALRSRRAYNEPKSFKQIEDILRREKGTTFNPILVDIFLRMINPENLQPDEESQNIRILTSMPSPETEQSDLKAESSPLSDVPNEKANDQNRDAGIRQKEDTVMDNNLRLEKLVDQLLAENRIDEAVSTLYGLIVTYAKEKNFTKAEMLREKLYEIDSMALNEIISSAEIIEQEKQKGMTQDHQKIWAELYRSLEKEEGNSLYYSMKEASYDIDQPLFTQGEDNSNLYFIMQGQLKMFCRHHGQEVLLKELNPGDILGIETFFYNSVCTTSVSPLSRVNVNYVKKSVLQEWKEKFPQLESKLYKYCLKFEKSRDLLKKKGLDRRVPRRFRAEGTASIQILSSTGDSVGKSFKGVIFDISALGLACIVKLVKKEIAQLLLGRQSELKLVLKTKGGSRTVDIVGTVVAVSSPPYDDYHLHFKFHQLLDSNLIREIGATETAG